MMIHRASSSSLFAILFVVYIWATSTMAYSIGSRSQMSMYIDGNRINDVASKVASQLSTTSKAASNQNIQANVMKGAAHIASVSDVTPFFKPTMLQLRLFAVMGQILNILHDYIPDHTIASDDFIFQMVMLAISTDSLVKSASPLLASATAAICHRDLRSYHALFSPSGFSWQQYRSMIGSGVVTFVDVQPGDVISSDENANDFDGDAHDLYWLYSGEAKVNSKGTTIQSIQRKAKAPRLNDANYMALLNTVKVACRIDKERCGNNKNIRIHNTCMSYPRTTIYAGEDGATLLRINIPKLINLMDHDDQLGQAVRSMLVEGIQETMGYAIASAAAGNGDYSELLSEECPLDDYEE